MSATYFPTPAGVQDYTDKQNYQKWSKFIGDSMNDTIKEEEKTVGAGKCQFYNPEIKPAGKDKDTAKVTWNGFPRRLEQDYPDDYMEVADKHDGWPHDGEEYTKARNQDEYLEWYVHKNTQGKITRVDFTCEGPEYWDLLFQWEPQTCLALYRQHISADVKLDDLYIINDEGKQEYNVYNKWNTTDGCMHLNCPPNSLSAEIQLAGDASIIRQKNGKIITNSQELINCSKYGRPDRNSDPKIGSACNALCIDGNRITVGNPVCLFISNVKSGGWRTPDGKDAFKYMKLVRGTTEHGLRYRLEVPASEGFTVGDITIGGEPISYGGSIAYLTDVALVAEYCKDDQGAQPAYSCVPDDPTYLASHFTLKVASMLGKAKNHYVHRGYSATFSPCQST